MVEAFGQYDVAKKVRNTPVYQQAYELFSQLPDQTWLMELESIPQSIEPLAGSFIQPRKIYQANNQLFSQAIQQVNALLQRYQQWKNSTPVEQVNQLEQAGINAAVTGTDVSGSDMSDPIENSFADTVYPDSDLSVVANFCNTVASLFSAATGGITSFMNAYTAVRNTDLVEMTGVSAVSNYLREQGLTGLPMFSNWKDIQNWYNEFGQEEYSKLHEGDLSKKLLLSDLQQLFVNGVRGKLWTNPDDGDPLLNDRGEKFVNSIVESGIEAYDFGLRYQKALNKYNFLLQANLDPIARAENFKDQDSYQTAILEAQQFIAKEKRRLWEYNQEFLPKVINNAKTPYEKALLFRMLYGITSQDQAGLRTQGIQNVAAGVKGVTGMVSDTANAVSDVMEAGFDVATGGVSTVIR